MIVWRIHLLIAFSGVPQGSIPEPLLYIYVYYLQSCVIKGNLCLRRWHLNCHISTDTTKMKINFLLSPIELCNGSMAIFWISTLIRPNCFIFPFAIKKHVYWKCIYGGEWRIIFGTSRRSKLKISFSNTTCCLPFVLKSFVLTL